MTNEAPPTKQSFWTTLPGILTGVAALITALVAVAGLFLAHGGGSAQGNGSSTGSHARSANGSGSSGAGSAGAGSASPTGDGTAATVGASQLVLRPGDWVDVDTGSSGSNSTGGDLIWASNQISLYGVRNAIVAGHTDKAGCTAALQHRSDSYVTADQLRERPVVCLSTDQGAVAELRFTAPDLHNDVRVTMTVWH